MERVGQLGALAKRLKRFDRGPTSLFRVVMAGLLHQRDHETSVRPSDSALVAGGAERLDRSTGDAFGLGDGIRTHETAMHAP